MKIDLEEDVSLKRFLALAAIEGPSGREGAVSAAIERDLVDAGVPLTWIARDGAQDRTPPIGDDGFPGETGNLIVRMPGNDAVGPATMLSAHMDTVPICVGCRPEIRGDYVVSQPDRGLGGDDRAGCAVVLTAALHRWTLSQQTGESNLPPAVFVWFVQEEIGLRGSRALDRTRVGTVDRAFNFDGGDISKLTVGATGGERMRIVVSGVASHAGVAPERGLSAITIASVAIADLHQRGWLGRIENDHGAGTANVGVIQGGEATNVVTPRVELRAEARSHDAAMRTRIVREIREAFQRAATQVTDIDGGGGSIEFESRVDYESFRLEDDDPSRSAAQIIIERLCPTRTVTTKVADGGLDANQLFGHGIAAVTLGCGQMKIHTVDECLHIEDYQAACRVAIALVQRE